MALTALGVNGNYIGGLAHVGYRPRTIHALVEFKALGITPEWIGGFVRAGYGDLPADELVQLKALNVTPDFIAGFDRIGYRNIPAAKLVQLKALDITPEFVRSAVGERADAAAGQRARADEDIRTPFVGWSTLAARLQIRWSVGRNRLAWRIVRYHSVLQR